MTQEQRDLLTKQGYCTRAQYQEFTGQAPSPTKRRVNLSTEPGTVYFVELVLDHPRRGAVPNPNSDAQRQPWLEQGVSEATYYRHQKTEKKWAETFAKLGAQDTPANRQAYKHLAKAAGLLGVRVSDLWSKLVSTMTHAEPALASYSESGPLPLHSPSPSSSGECDEEVGSGGSALSSSDESESVEVRCTPPRLASEYNGVRG